MTTPPVDGELQVSQREVQRLLGRCLLRLQQYEHLIKAIVAHHDIWPFVFNRPRGDAMEKSVMVGAEHTEISW